MLKYLKPKNKRNIVTVKNPRTMFVMKLLLQPVSSEAFAHSMMPSHGVENISIDGPFQGSNRLSLKVLRTSVLITGTDNLLKCYCHTLSNIACMFAPGSVSGGSSGSHW